MSVVLHGIVSGVIKGDTRSSDFNISDEGM